MKRTKTATEKPWEKRLPFYKISDRTRLPLLQAGITTYETLAGWSDKELKRLPGLGIAGLEEIHSLLEEAGKRCTSETQSS